MRSAKVGHSRSGGDGSNILLMGFYGRKNFGDDLLGLSVAHYLLDHSNAKIQICTASDRPFRQLMERSDRVSVVQRRPLHILRALFNSSVLCQGGGTIFHDSYSGWRRWQYQLNLFAWMTLFWLARSMGVKVVLVGGGIGPLKLKTSKAFALVALKCCNAIGVRDEASRICAGLLVGKKVPVFLGADLAELWERQLSANTNASGKETLQIAVSLLDLSPFVSNKIADDYWRTLAKSFRASLRGVNVHIHIISLYSDVAKGDIEAARQFRDKLKDAFECTLHAYSSDVSEMLELIGSCDVVIAARYHAAVAAFVAGRPFWVISYKKKVIDFANDIRLDPALVLKTDSLPNVDYFSALVASLMSSKGEPDARGDLRNARRGLGANAITRAFERAGVTLS